jgi:hypothetical protein
MSLTEETDQYAVYIRKSYDELSLIENKIKTLDPSDVRQNYDNYWDLINKKEIEINEEKEELEESINNLEDGKELVDKKSEIIQNIKTIMNSLRVGTLQGITRQTIKEYNIVPEPNDEIAQNVLDQPYDELEDINRNQNQNQNQNQSAGLNKRRKTNKRKTNKRKTNKRKTNKRKKKSKRYNKYK